MSEFLTKQDVAKKYKLSLKTVDYLVTSNQIPFMRISKRLVRFDSGKLEKFFKERENLKVLNDKKRLV